MLSDDDGDRFYESKAHVLNLLRGGFGGSLEGFDLTHILVVTWDRVRHTNGTVRINFFRFRHADWVLLQS